LPPHPPRLLSSLHCSPPHPNLHSFPTRRSSDLLPDQPTTTWRSSNRSSRGWSGAMKSSGVNRRSRSPLPSRSLLPAVGRVRSRRSEEHTSELQSRENLVCRLLLEKKQDAWRAAP